AARKLCALIELGGRDSNPDSQIQSLESYHWTTSQRLATTNLQMGRAVVKCRARRFVSSRAGRLLTPRSVPRPARRALLRGGRGAHNARAGASLAPQKP